MADTEQQAMTSERLEQIRAMLGGFQYGTITITSAGEHIVETYTAHHSAQWAMAELLAEVERLRLTLAAKEMREAALLAVVRAMAEAGQERLFSAGGNDYATYVLPHKIGEQARALVASAGDGEQGEA